MFNYKFGLSSLFSSATSNCLSSKTIRSNSVISLTSIFSGCLPLLLSLMFEDDDCLISYPLDCFRSKFGPNFDPPTKSLYISCITEYIPQHIWFVGNLKTAAIIVQSHVTICYTSSSFSLQILYRSLTLNHTI